MSENMKEHAGKAKRTKKSEKTIPEQPTEEYTIKQRIIKHYDSYDFDITILWKDPIDNKTRARINWRDNKRIVKSTFVIVDSQTVEEVKEINPYTANTN